MNLTVRSLLVVFLLTEVSLWSAPPASTIPTDGITVDLGHRLGSRPIGIEPQGGRFEQVIGPRAKTPYKYSFSIFAKNQDTGVLSIYATNESLILLERPLARIEISGLQPGKTKHGILVHLDPNKVSDRTVTVWAEDLDNGRRYGVRKLENKDLLVKLKEPADASDAHKLPPIALGPQDRAPKNSSAGQGQYIGYRSAGGMFTPILHPGDASRTEPRTAYFTTIHPGQTSIDLRLFASDSPYIEKAAPSKRYIISGITPYEHTRGAVRLELKIDERGKISRSATEVTFHRNPISHKIEPTDIKTVQVDDYSNVTRERLKSVLGRNGSDADDSFPAIIPAEPRG